MPDTIGVLDKDGAAVTVKTNDALHTQLVAILAKLSADPATQTTLAAILAKLIAAPATEAKQDTANTSLASILAKLIAAPATEAKQDAAAALLALIGTRAYAAGERISVLSSSGQSNAIAATEVVLHPDVRCYVLAGANPAVTATTGIPLEAGEKFHMRITSGHKIAVIRASADGLLNINPVA